MHRAPAAMVTVPVADPNVEIRTPRDPNTLSNYHNFLTMHTSVDFDIDFAKKRLFGSVVLSLESLTEEIKEVVLDSRYVRIHWLGWWARCVLLLENVIYLARRVNRCAV